METRPNSLAVERWGELSRKALFIVWKVRNRGYHDLGDVIEFRKMMDLPSSETSSEEWESHQRLASAPSRGPASQMSCLPPARPDAPPAASEAPASPGRSAARTSQVGGSRKKPPRAQHGGGDEGADGGGGWWSTRYHPTPPETQELEMVQKHEKD